MITGTSAGAGHRYLVTADFGLKMDTWAVTCMFTNWIEGRDNGDRETWLVTVFDQDARRFLEACELIGVTVEEIHGAGDTETYELVLGKPGTGWKN